MPSITAKDGATIFYKDWGSGQPVVFSHGWPLNSDAWDEQLLLFASNGWRRRARAFTARERTQHHERQATQARFG